MKQQEIIEQRRVKKQEIIETTKSENTRNYWKVAKIQNFVWDKNDFYVIHLAKRDNKGCVPNLNIKILPFPISLSQNTFTTMHINSTMKNRL